MTFEETVVRAFECRQIPRELIERSGGSWPASDEEDAEWFRLKNWRDITWQDWMMHSSAVFVFTNDALAYYLPSLLILSSQNTDDWLIAADSFIRVLASVIADDGLNKTNKSNCIGFRREEREVIKEWLLLLKGTESYDNAFDAVRLDQALKVMD